MIHSTLSLLSVEKKRVFLRVDANVPIENGIIQSYFRLNALKETIDFLVHKKSTIVFATHMGRPDKPTKELSTQHLIPWFVAQGYTVYFAKTIKKAHALSIQNQPMIIVLENLRFFKGEKNQTINFAQKLAALGEFYVNDAFAALHRSDTSLTLVPKLFASNKRCIGFLIQKEITHLNILLKKPRSGFTLIIGGGKVATKIPLIKAFIPKVETIILCPGIVFTFLKAQGMKTGKSLVDENNIPLCKDIIALARQYNTKIIYPIDYLITKNMHTYTESSSIPDNYASFSIGKKSTELFQNIIKKSKTIFYNGMMGTSKQPATLLPTKKLFITIADTNAYTVIAGGDSIALAEQANIDNRIAYLSSGGGATLAYLAGETLPGLIAFNE